MANAYLSVMMARAQLPDAARNIILSFLLLFFHPRTKKKKKKKKNGVAVIITRRIEIARSKVLPSYNVFTCSVFETRALPRDGLG